MVWLGYDVVAPKVHFVPISQKMTFFSIISHLRAKKSTDAGAGRLLAFAGAITLCWSTI